MGATLTYLGHSSFLVKTGGGKTLYIDPWLEGNPRCPQNLQAPQAADLICVTHGHFDHTSGVIPVFKKKPCTVTGPYELVNLLAADGDFGDKANPMNKGGTVAVGDIKVTLTHAMHSSSYGKPGTYAGEPCGLVITFEDGKKIYDAGDTALFGDMRFIGELYAPDLCLLPIGDRFTMDPRQAAVAAELLGAKRVVPIHHSTFPPLTGTPAQFQDEVKKRGLKTEVVVLEPGQTVTV
jgi:L-ascorbate metabolism protein UlaG (beta-lactamase superfamily)